MVLVKSYQPEKVNAFILLITLALMPLKQDWLSITLAALILNGIFAILHKNPIPTLKQSSFLHWCLMYGLIYIVGMIGTSNLEAAKFDALQKCGLGIILFLLLIGGGIQNTTVLKRSKLVFVGANGLALLLCFILSFQDYWNTKDLNSFFYINFSHFMHPGYFAMYLCFCIALLLENLYKIKANNSSNFYKVLLLIFFAVGVYLLASKSGIITMFLLFGLFLMLWIKLKVQQKKLRIALILSSLIILVFLAFQPSTSNRLSTIINDLKTFQNKDDETVDTAGQRLLIWQSALGVIKDNFLIGTGVGNDNDALHKAFESRGYDFLLEKKLNAHNQFLQTFLALGVSGFLFFLSFMLLPFYFGLKNKDVLLICLGVIILTNAMTESIFNRQAGILFWGIWGLLLMKISKNKHNEIEQ